MKKYIISLTTIPSKFDNLYQTIDSIISQKLFPNKIIINIPTKYSFRLNGSIIPENKINDFMDKYSKFGVYINIINNDYGPGTKLLGTLENNMIADFNPQETYVLLIDDDLIYKDYMIENIDSFIKNTGSKIGSFHTYKYKDIKIAQGADCLYINISLLKNFLKYFNLIKDKDYILYHDDFYISYYFHLMSQEINHLIPPNKCNIYETHSETFIDALCKLDGKYKRNNLNKNIYDILYEMKNNNSFIFLNYND